ncbi:hypothetical protein ACJMBT_001501, partial [Campylobacter lari]|nr:galactosyltransferase [Campylobacter lari]EAI8653923.1 galactosyltransferase [Campylobacter lari]EAJ5703535.1 galactosyltransferase [Campylobacter lari]EKN0024622.1 hypothetical protein [Campylobacter lari]EKP0409184.1 hypothetical protein [Campylobacter lari]
MMKKLAIQLFGHMRTYELTYQKFRENIIEVNLKDGWEIDLFIHTWDKFNSSSKSWHENLNLFSNDNYLTEEDKNKIQKLYNPKILNIESLEDGVHGGLLSKIRGNELRKQYSKKTNSKYNYILYTRPDLLFINPFRIDTFLSIYLQGAYKNIGLPEKHTFCCNNFFRGRKVADPRVLNEGDLIYFSSVEQNLFRPEENKDFLNISLDYTLHKDFFIQREKFIHGWRSHP